MAYYREIRDYELMMPPVAVMLLPCPQQCPIIQSLLYYHCIVCHAPTLEAASPPLRLLPPESPPRYSKVKACVTIPSVGQTAFPERKGLRGRMAVEQSRTLRGLYSMLLEIFMGSSLLILG